jgi:hypothetical protein
MLRSAPSVAAGRSSFLLNGSGQTPGDLRTVRKCCVAQVGGGTLVMAIRSPPLPGSSCASGGNDSANASGLRLGRYLLIIGLIRRSAGPSEARRSTGPTAVSSTQALPHRSRSGIATHPIGDGSSLPLYRCKTLCDFNHDGVAMGATRASVFFTMLTMMISLLLVAIVLPMVVAFIGAVPCAVRPASWSGMSGP